MSSRTGHFALVASEGELLVLLASLLTVEFDPAAFDKWKAANPA